MTKKKAVICTIMFAIMVVGTCIALMFVKPYESEISLFHFFCPCIVGNWIGERINKFYDWLMKNN